MNEIEFARYLKNHLKIRIDNVWLGHDYSLVVKLLLDDTVISEDHLEYSGI